jgi:hypothetical protein
LKSRFGSAGIGAQWYSAEWKDYDPGYYAVYFEDPDRMKLELVYVPGDL